MNYQPKDEAYIPKKLHSILDETVEIEESNKKNKDLVESQATDLTKRELSHSKNEQLSRVLVLYCGGTIGMRVNKDNVYEPVGQYLHSLLKNMNILNDTNYPKSHDNEFVLPPLKNHQRLAYYLMEYEPLIDSANMTMDDWVRIALDIKDQYSDFDGFVVLQGTDTLAYTASALSFMCEDLGKPIIVTGSQIPISECRSDGRDNLMGALIFAGFYQLPEVCVYFRNRLFRGNRCVKVDANSLKAFDSPNFPQLASMGTFIQIARHLIRRRNTVQPFVVHTNMNRNVGVLRLFPGITQVSVKSFLAPPMQGVVLQSFGMGNIPSLNSAILNELKKATERDIIIVNTTQCQHGRVESLYAAGSVLNKAGVIWGGDMSVEAGLAKLSYVLGKSEWSKEKKRAMMVKSLRGEVTESIDNELDNEEEHYSYHLESSPTKYVIEDLLEIETVRKYIELMNNDEKSVMKSMGHLQFLIPSAFEQALVQSDIELIEKFVHCGVDINMKLIDGKYPIHVAVIHGELSVINFLLDHKVDVDVHCSSCTKPLLLAVKLQRLSVIKRLIEHGATLPYSQIQIGARLCQHAAENNEQQLNSLLAAEADVNTKDYSGCTAIHAAVLQNNIKIVQLLVKNNCDLNYSFNGLKPLELAKKHSFTIIVEYLTSLKKS
ncbi:hypothetical protein SNEBB_003091 [Seison nebaliae]|nr:hypothetical protein SNEBB_003091 [Seison nebaliae]